MKNLGFCIFIMSVLIFPALFVGVFTGDVLAADQTIPIIMPTVFAGANHSVALSNDGKIYTWGDNYYGQLGDGTTADKSTPVCISEITTSSLYGKMITAVVAGSRHNLAVDSDGKVYTWGDNEYGRLGDSTTADRTMPVCISDIVSSVLYGKIIISVAAGGSHSIAIDSDGNVYTWGYNYYGQLGDGTNSNRYTPVYINDITNSQLSGKKVIAITAGDRHSLALDGVGKVYTWGYNDYGQLGNNSTSSKNLSVCISDILASPLYGKKVTAINAGVNHNLAVDSDGKVYTWGYNNSGQLGEGTSTNRKLPVCISESNALQGKTVIAVAAGGNHSLSLDENGKIYAWGDNAYGQLGDGSVFDKATPTLISDIATIPLYGKAVTNITAGSDTSFAINNEGKVYAWGYNYSGELGNGMTSISPHPIPACITQNTATQLYGKAIAKVAAGGSHNLIVDSEGKVNTWGDNYYGQVGDGTIIITGNPAPICISDIVPSLLYGKTITAISAGSNHSIALSEGKVYAWGDNSYGRLGDGTSVSKSTPVCISDIESSLLYGKTITTISAGGSHSIALSNEGKIYAWGSNQYGKLGDGSTTYTFNPICISDIVTSPLYGKIITAISAGGEHTLAVDSEGKAYAWGYGKYGQLGNNNTVTTNPTPICISDISASQLNGKTVTTVAAGSSHSLALDIDGKAYAWGYANNGRLGDGTTIDKSLPVCISNVSTSPFYGKTLSEIYVGSTHSFALDSLSKVYAWGENSYGKLGDGTTDHRNIPVCISEIESSPLYGKTVMQISAGGWHSLAVDMSGSLYTWGSNSSGQLGFGTSFANSIISADGMQDIRNTNIVHCDSIALFNETERLASFPQDGGQYDVKTAYINAFSNDGSVYYILVIKSNNKIIELQIEPKNLTSNSIHIFESTVNLPSAELYPSLDVKTMLWDNIDSILPITLPIELNR